MEQREPGLQVKLSTIPAGSAGGYAKMYSAPKAGNAPDLAHVEYREIPSLLLEDGLEEIGQYGADEDQDSFVDWQWQPVA